MDSFCEAFIKIFEAGGVLMYPIVAMAFFLYFSGFEVCFRMRRWNKICSDDALFKAAYSRYVLSLPRPPGESFADLKKTFSLLRSDLTSGIDRRLATLKALSAAVPLLGLLGTVSGMMLSISSAANDPSGVAEGISSALITTQAGLVAAIPAWIVVVFAGAQTQRLMISIAQRESDSIRRAL